MSDAEVYHLDDYRNRPSPEEQRTKHLQTRLAEIGLQITVLTSERDRIVKVLGDTVC